MKKKRLCLIVAASLAVISTPVPAGEPAPLEFDITFSKTVRSKPFTGRVLIFLADKQVSQPRTQFSWFRRQTFFSKDVRDWKPGEVLRVRQPKGYPYDLKDLPPKEYAVQAVMHTNRDRPHSGTAEGNLYSKTVRRELDPISSGAIKLEIDQCVTPPNGPLPGPRAKHVELRSELLSKFHGRDITMRAVVIPPEDYDTQPKQRFPAIYVIPGFGVDHHEAARYALRLGKSSVPFVRIGLDPTTGWGHHVFADSAVNGPCARSLIEEFIPHLEREFRLIPEPRARFLTGHSSGGWSSLWLQVNYPDFFGGSWSTAPDPVTFASFCSHNLYADETNAYVDSQGRPRPLIRLGNRVVMTVQDFVRMEDTLGPGGQLGSFEAVFGPRSPDGSPKRLFDRATGKVDTEVTEAWQKYDILLKFQRECLTLRPKLMGKLTIIVGEQDNFYLNEAVGLLKKALDACGSDARVTIVPKMDHSSVIYSPPVRAIPGEMSRKFLDSMKKPETAGPTTTKPTGD